MLVAVIIPAYKSILNDDEVLSIKRTLKILKSHPIYLLTHHALNLDAYRSLFLEADVSFQIAFFDKVYFDSIKGYNQLMLHRGFYKHFSNYQYLLICQLDAYVFKDTLDEWCNKNFSYIGAPWVIRNQNGIELSGVGNGGLSLRHIHHHIKVLSRFSFIESPLYLFKRYWSTESEGPSRFMRMRKWLRRITISNNTYHAFNDYYRNEDYFWGKIAPTNFKWFKIPDEHTAAQFSIEEEPEVVFKMIGEELPFGCHAFMKYNVSFWKTFIPELN